MNGIDVDQPGLVSPRDYLSRANDFYCACHALPDFSPNFMPLWPQHALFGHAIELVLKALLLDRGEEENAVKKYGHRLYDLHTRAVGLGLQTDKGIMKMIGFIEEPYSTHVGRYPDPKTIGNPIAVVQQFYPDYGRLIEAVNAAMSS